MALINTYAGGTLARLRREAGHSPESLAAEIRQRAKSETWGTRGTVDAHTIRRIEGRGHVPGMRVQFVLARYFDLRPEQLWDANHAVAIAAAAASAPASVGEQASC